MRFRPSIFGHPQIAILVAVTHLLAGGIGGRLLAAPIVVLSMEASLIDGSPVDLLRVGDTFRISAIVEDRRSPPAGVYSAYADLLFPSDLTRLASDVRVGEAFSVGRTDFGIRQGVLDEYGGVVSDFASPGVVKSLLFSADFTAIAPGELSFQLSPAGLVHHETLLLGHDGRLRARDIEYGMLSILVVPEPGSASAILIGLASLIHCTRKKSVG